MERIEISSWTEFKQICITQKNLNCQYGEHADSYDLYGPDCGAMLWCFTLPKTAGSDLTDFEDNHKDNFNWAIGQRGYAFSTNDFTYVGNAVYGTCTAGQTVDIDFTLPETLYTNGGDIVLENSVLGDWVEVHVIHPVYGAIADYVKKRYVPASPAGHPTPVMAVHTPYAGKIPAGLKMRLTYHSTGGTDVKIGINYNLHKPL
jgi:hypothetical protein